MTKEQILRFAEEYTEASPLNYVRPEEAILPELTGKKLFEAPLIGVSAADDPLFERMKEPGVVGPQYRLPGEWLPEAKTVVSFFFPFTGEVRRSNLGGTDPSPLWLHARIEGQRFLCAFGTALRDALIADGNKAVVPVVAPGFAVGPGFTSNWSERHAAFISGLGTFSLTRGLITEKGMAGRFVSLVTSLELPVTERAYTEVYEYCIRCGLCAKVCPAHAISLEKGKEQEPCSAYLNGTKVRFAPRYGCGKCQIGVPCETRNPAKKKKQRIAGDNSL